MANYAAAECSTLVRVEMMAAELATSYTANRMNKVGSVKVFEPILVRVVGVGPTVEIVGGRVLPTFLVTCILWSNSVHV